MKSPHVHLITACIASRFVCSIHISSHTRTLLLHSHTTHTHTHTRTHTHTQDGHVDVARLLLDHGAQVNMPADSFESPLTLAASGGHYELAALLISRGADLEEVNDEG